jgi:hypothetical protein
MHHEWPLHSRENPINQIELFIGASAGCLSLGNTVGVYFNFLPKEFIFGGAAMASIYLYCGIDLILKTLDKKDLMSRMYEFSSRAFDYLKNTRIARSFI